MTDTSVRITVLGHDLSRAEARDLLRNLQEALGEPRTVAVPLQPYRPSGWFLGRTEPPTAPVERWTNENTTDPYRIGSGITRVTVSN